ncbi:MAG: BACON domain-containing protein, partial [Tidjanibacter sp.]|nr:BACON domain-containing protein [Tidjanibacter sp.]
MKKLFAVGCNEQGGGDINPNDPTPDNIFLSLDKETVSISPDGGSVDVIVYSNYKWEISGTSDWCTPSATSGGANEDGQKVSFSADVTYDNREATFWFRCAEEKIKFTVSQSFKEVIIADENNTFSVPAEGGVAVLNYQTSVECEVVIPEEAKSWITIAPADATRGLMAESVQLDVAENTTYSARSAVVKVVKVGDNSLFAEYTINQVQNDAIIADENNTFELSGIEQSINIAYRTNVECEVV